MRFKGLRAITAIILTLVTTSQPLSAEEFLLCSAPSAERIDFSNSLRHTLRGLDRGGEVQLQVEELGEPNAFALRDRNTILVSTKLYSLIKSSAEEAFLVAHELGHLKSPTAANWAPLVDSTGLSEEQAADRYALLKLHSLNLDTGAGARLLNRLKSRDNSTASPQLYYHIQRLSALEQGQAENAINSIRN